MLFCMSYAKHYERGEVTEDWLYNSKTLGEQNPCHEKLRQCVIESHMVGTGIEVIEGMDRAAGTFWNSLWK